MYIIHQLITVKLIMINRENNGIFVQGNTVFSGYSVCPCVRECVYPSFACPRDNSGPVQARITKFGPKMQSTVVMVPFWFWGQSTLTLKRSNLTSKSKFVPFWACLHHNSSPVQARITKFGSHVRNILVKIPIVLGGNWPWPSRSNLI